AGQVHIGLTAKTIRTEVFSHAVIILSGRASGIKNTTNAIMRLFFPSVKRHNARMLPGQDIIFLQN
ncbi:MAG: hypothetical protein MSP08_06865, partial [Clostridiales bacterium]|nr:hypothetical protein [Clostridiales bacterium]